MTILGTVPVKDFLYDELAELVLPANILLEANTDEVEVPSDPRFQIAQKMEGFIKRFSQVGDHSYVLILYLLTHVAIC
jgi:hypothetical protein